MSILALDKWARLMRIIASNGGPIKALEKLWRIDTVKEGKLMGCDAFGNKYYENKYYMLGRSRWVEYNPQFKWEYDASQVTAEWYGWIHYKTDRLPCEDCAKFCLNSCCWSHCWLLPHAENLSGSELAYYPYSTSRARIVVWDAISYSLNFLRGGHLSTNARTMSLWFTQSYFKMFARLVWGDLEYGTAREENAAPSAAPEDVQVASEQTYYT